TDYVAFRHPGTRPCTATLYYAARSGPQAFPPHPAHFRDLRHPYGNSGNYTITVTVTDSSGASGSDTLSLTVHNVAPTVNAGPDTAIDEGGTFTGSGSFTDPGTETWTATVDYGDGSGVQAL